MSFEAVVMMLIGLGVTWGGALFCLNTAFNKKKQES
jgi:hypothetical protein